MPVWLWALVTVAAADGGNPVDAAWGPWVAAAKVTPAPRCSDAAYLRRVSLDLLGLLGGAEGTRTPDPLDANEVRYQLRHSPGWWCRDAETISR